MRNEYMILPAVLLAVCLALWGTASASTVDIFYYGAEEGHAGASHQQAAQGEQTLLAAESPVADSGRFIEIAAYDAFLRKSGSRDDADEGSQTAVSRERPTHATPGPSPQMGGEVRPGGSGGQKISIEPEYDDALYRRPGDGKGPSGAPAPMRR